MLTIHLSQLLLQLSRLLRLAQQRIQHDQIRNRVGALRVDADGLLQRSLGFGQSAKMQFGDGLCDERVWGLRLRGLREFFENVECRLVFLAALSCHVSEFS